MYNNFGLTFEYGFDSDFTYSYLVLKLDNNTKLLNHQIEIICQNPNSAFVPFHIRREDENVSIYYNITSKVSLLQYLEKKSLNKKEFLDLLKNITKNLMLHTNYLLDLSSFVIDAELIYINPATAEISLIYVPAVLDRDIIGVFIAFLKDLVVNSARVDDSARDNYMQKILNYLKSESFSLSDFNRLISDLRNDKEVYEYRKSGYNQESVPGMIISESCSLKEEANEDVSENRNIRSIIFLQLYFVAAAAIVCIFMRLKGMGDTVSLAGVILIAAALDALVTKKISMGQKNQASTQGKKQRTVSKRSDNLNNIREQTPSPNRDVLRAYDTVMVSEASKDYRPYLEGVEANTAEKIIISKDKFIIGRMESMVDYTIQDKTVGKLHAKIFSDKGCYYIMDLNSKNGSYVNGVRIPSNKEYEIKKNDNVRFSNFQYVFRLPEVVQK